MNKFIISLCFLMILSLHILLFLYYRNTQIISSKPNQNSTLLLQLTKVKEEIQKTIEPKIEEKKKFPEKEKVKELIKKEKLPNKAIIKKSQKKVEELEEVEKVEELKKEPIEKNTNKPTENSKQKIEKPIPQINNQEKKYIDNYSSKLREEINKNKDYPTISKKLKEEGRVLLSFRVLKSGQFTNIRILVSSGKERLDKAALNALYETKEYEPFHDSINKEYLDFELPLEFKLN
jgi:periplasmic protein TonB